ncbi:hypothetical protein M8J76_004846 [Diaphorina citri]|nr:hypothetical protein M8J76_004846 [Diaphorina citri]
MKNGSLSSPEYPGTYPPRTTCRYEFQGRGKERVQIVFTDFSLYHPGDESREDSRLPVTSMLPIIRMPPSQTRIPDVFGRSSFSALL